MGKTKENYGVENLGKNSQVARLRKIEKSAKRTLIVGIVLLLCVAIAMAAYVKGSIAQLECTMLLNQYRLGSKTLTTAVQSYAVTGDQKFYDDYMNELNVDKNRDIAWAGLQENNIKDYEWEELKNIASLSDGLVPLETQAMEAVKNGDNTSAIEFVFGQEYDETIDKINSLTDETINGIQNRLQTTKSVYFMVMLACALAFVAGFVGLVKQLTGAISFSNQELLQPIIKVSKQMSLLAEGDLHTDIDLYVDDSEVGNMVAAIAKMKQILENIIKEVAYVLGEMGEGNYRISIEQEYVGDFKTMEESLRKIIEEMREIIGTVKVAADEVDSGSAQLADAAEDLANACTTQASQVSGIVELVKELEKSIEYNEQEAEEAVKISNLAGSTLVQSSMKMEELKAAIEEINECSRQVTEVLASIEDIAEQINLLSLNASIESARAGEAGRGFAVVAEQVKKLAEESQVAVGHTAELINKTVESVNKGTAIADEAAESMVEVTMGAKESTDRVSGIVEKLKGEVQSIMQLNDSINSVASIVDNNSATSQETAAISEEQKAQVESMVQIMNKFTV